MANNKKVGTAEIIFGLSLVMVLIMGAVLAIFWKKLPPELPWYYSLPWGEKQLVAKMVFIWIFGGMIGILTFTKFLASWAGNKDETVEITVNTGGLIAVTLVFASFARVMSIFLPL